MKNIKIRMITKISVFLIMILLPMFTLEVHADNNTSATATVISVNSTKQDHLTSSSDVNWYRATVSSAGYISLTFNHDILDANNLYWYAYLYDSNIKQLARYLYYGRESSKTEANIGVPAGTYYVKISCSVYSGVNYNIKLNFTNASSWEKEFNDSQQAAQTISVNNSVYGSMRSSDDIDWYKVNVSSAGYISLTFNHDILDANNLYWYAYLYDSNIKQLARYLYYGRESSKTEANIGVPAGTYYVKISCSVYSGANYQLCLSYINSLNISNMTASLSNTSYVYDGAEKKPKVTLKDGSTILTEGTDYTVTYSNNINAGTATVKVTGKGNYSGTKTLTFTIKSNTNKETDM